MQQGRMGVRLAALLCAAFLGGCTLSDSLRNDAVASVWPSSPAVVPPTVVYATDRAPGLPETVGDFRYGLHWDAALHCGTAKLTLTTGWPQFGTEKLKDTACDGDMGGFARALKEQSPPGCTHALLYVHGYNTTFRTALLRAGQIAADTYWHCATAVFSWASEGKVDRYAADIERSGYSVPELAGAIRASAHDGLTLDIVAHSMGTRLVLSALSALSRSCKQTAAPMVGELVLAAPDVSAEHDNDDFQHLLAGALPCVTRVTVYASDNDEILIVSESVHGGVPRAGRVPERDLRYPDCLALPADIVDASLAPGDPKGHGYLTLSYEMMRDVRWTLAGKTLAERAGNGIDGGPTLTALSPLALDCGTTAARYGLLVAPDRQPDWTSRLWRRVIAAILSVQ
jgi:Alpha/beta hydrolase of unknown function (DUF900)